MNDFVSDHRITLGVSVSVLLLGWGAVVSPGGSWPGMLSTAALATLLVTSTTALLLGCRMRAAAVSLAQALKPSRRRMSQELRGYARHAARPQPGRRCR